MPRRCAAGRAFGAGDPVALRRGAAAAITLALTWAAIAVTAFLTIPNILIGAYLSPDEVLRPEILALGASLLVFGALYQLADATQVIALSLLRGMQDTRAPMWIAAASYWLIGAMLAYVLTFPVGLGAPGVWIGLVAGLSSAAVLLGSRFLRRAAHMGPLSE